MDPDATYDTILEAIARKDWAEATEYARHLWNWLASGGFCPIRSELPTAKVPNGHQNKRAAGLLPLLNGINVKIRFTTTHALHS